MRPSKRDEVSGLLHSTWSALASRSRRAMAGAETMWNGVNGTTPVQSHEHLYLMPGWAVKRRQAGEARSVKRSDVTPFDLHVSTAGFAAAARELHAASATQRAVVSIAKRFAALPPIAPTQTLGNINTDGAYVPRYKARQAPEPTSVRSDSYAATELAHTNLDSRLMPFWSKAITGRRISFAVYTMHKQADAESVTRGPAGALFETSTRTDDQGLFTHHFVVPWERLCTHPPSIAMACHDPKESGPSDWQVLVKAEIQPLPSEEDGTSASPTPTTRGSVERTEQLVIERHEQTARTREPRPLNDLVHHAKDAISHAITPADDRSQIVIAISEPKGVRVISDLDDTIKHSDILAGPREVFRNVFCRPLHDLCVPGMAELYRSLASEGVDGFHMISNSPFELYTSIRDFMSIHKFPSIYSLKLKYYGGRSLLSSLMEPAGDRKKPAVVEVLDAFPESSFILFGDSGEQDLEVYSSVARERPDQVRGIFIRDITSGRADALNVFDRSRNTNTSSSRSSSTVDLESLASNDGVRPQTPVRQNSASSSMSVSSSDIDLSDEIRSLSSAQQKILRRAALWDTRMEKARREVPENVKLVFFSDAESAQAQAVPLVRELLDST